MLERYPEELPLPELGYKVKPERNILESTPERGPKKRRRLTTGTIDSLSGTCTFTEAQLSIFQEFWDDCLDDGLNEFLYPDFTRTQDLRKARFTSDYSWTKTGKDCYSVDLELELLP